MSLNFPFIILPGVPHPLCEGGYRRLLSSFCHGTEEETEVHHGLSGVHSWSLQRSLAFCPFHKAAHWVSLGHTTDQNQNFSDARDWWLKSLVSILTVSKNLSGSSSSGKEPAQIEQTLPWPRVSSVSILLITPSFPGVSSSIPSHTNMTQFLQRTWGSEATKSWPPKTRAGFEGTHISLNFWRKKECQEGNHNFL